MKWCKIMQSFPVTARNSAQRNSDWKPELNVRLSTACKQCKKVSPSMFVTHTTSFAYLKNHIKKKRIKNVSQFGLAV